jgi:hypothetical protein
MFDVPDFMNRRPISVMVIAWIYILVCISGIAAHITDFSPRHPFELEAIEALLVRLLGIVSGVFMLRRSNWARWLAVAWIAFHVGLSAFHSGRELVVHTLIFGLITFFLFRPRANEYFRAGRIAAESATH